MRRRLAEEWETSDSGGEEAGFGARCRARRSHDVEPWEDAASEAVASSGSEGGGRMRQEGGDNIEGEKKTPSKRKGNSVGSVFHISIKFWWREQTTVRSNVISDCLQGHRKLVYVQRRHGRQNWLCIVL